MSSKTKITFEESLEKLESCAEKLRNGSASLEESVELYNQSIIYYKQCTDILAKAKQKIEMIDPKTGKAVDFDEQ